MVREYLDSSKPLALFAGIYSRDKLRNAGFNFSSNQYILAVQKTNMDEYRLMKYDRHVPEATTRISDETRKKVSDILIEYSNNSSNTVFSSREKFQRSNLRIIRPEFQKLEEINLWSDSGPHFKNANCLYSACLELSQIFSSEKFKLNYFMENLGKSDANGRKHKYLKIYLIIVGYITSRYTESMQSVAFGSESRDKVKRDIRTNKYAPDRSNPLGSDTDIMGSTSRNTQRARMDMLRGIGVSLSS
ncbi:hypothetical protein BB560_007143 [Smittium megazygosporum]|uniref:Uncharacterized protein n=1 Tax=Smittium megazygosporum TaxID=133381 RepID=A0A2T9XYE2_9FUNG|nr:hypothetical protein BB560_007143 [Smittium megazygosporum]